MNRTIKRSLSIFLAAAMTAGAAVAQQSGADVARQAMARALAEKARNDAIVAQQRAAERAAQRPTPTPSPSPSPTPPKK